MYQSLQLMILGFVTPISGRQLQRQCTGTRSPFFHNFRQSCRPLDFPYWAKQPLTLPRQKQTPYSLLFWPSSRLSSISNRRQLTTLFCGTKRSQTPPCLRFLSSSIGRTLPLSPRNRPRMSATPSMPTMQPFTMAVSPS